MKSFKKGVLLFVCVAALMTSAIFGTMAYLVDTDSVVNTFTVGGVDIALDEALVGPDGKAVLDENGDPVKRVTENKYHLAPGWEYDKDPTVTVRADSDLSYIRMILTVYNASAVQAIVDNPDHGLTDFADLLGGWDETVWLYESFAADETANTISFEFRYKEAVDGYEENGDPADLVLEPLFTTLIVPGTVTNEELRALYGDREDEEGDFRMELTAHAMQALGFEDDEDGAWAAFDEEMQDQLPSALSETGITPAPTSEPFAG